MKVIITGAASGIGKAVALGLAAENGAAQMLLVDRDEAGLAGVLGELAGRVEVQICVADLVKPTECKRVVELMEATFDGLDAIVSNAGGLRAAPLNDLDESAFDFGFELNTRPTWLLGKAAFPMLCESRGTIVATASTAGEYPTPPLGSYGPSKAALIMLVRQMAVEWGGSGIRCNTVSPGPTMSGITQSVYADPKNRHERASHIPLGRIGTPEDIANAILFLINPKSAYISGINLTVDGGLTAGLTRSTGAGSGSLRNE